MPCDCQVPRTCSDQRVTSISIVADARAVRTALEVLMRAPALAGLAPDARGTVELVLAEVLNNVVEHAYARYPGEIAVTLTLAADHLHCAVTDSGLPMPDDRLPQGDPPGLGGDLPEGGFGWNLIRTLTTHLSYCRRGGRNHLEFVLPV